MTSSAATVDDQLVSAIEPWLQHMRWRSDFPQWRERRIHQEHYQDDRLAQIERVSGPIERQFMLDVGAGMGGFAVAAAVRGATVAACEFNPAYCRIIQLRAARQGAQVPVYNAAGEALPFVDAVFDTVVSWDVIEHVRAPRAMLEEFSRVLAPGGSAFVTAINRWAWNDPHYHIRGLNLLPRPWAERLIERRGRSKSGAAFQDVQRLSEMHYFSFPGFVALAEECGFRVVDLRALDLRAGKLHSRKRVRRQARRALRLVGAEEIAYRLQRHWYTGMFELALLKDQW